MTNSNRFGPGQALVALLLNPTDPGYQEAAERRRASGVTRRWYDTPAVAVGCLLIGFTLAFAYVHTHRGAPEAAKVHSSLVQRVRSAEGAANSLAKQVSALATQLDRARNAELGSASVQNHLTQEQVAAAQTAVTGPGLQVTLANPKSGAPLTDADVRSVVNELWADGAEAIAVNDVRLAPGSAIRFAGNVVLVDFQPVASPYVIRAVGVADTLATNFALSDVAARYATQASAVGIGFHFADESTLRLPAAAPVSLRYAKPTSTMSGGSR